ncbi:MAG: DNRLRE domain-containing protein, partial [Ruminococcus sp.]|nr:DNRLRE domain-containing protein [Ruminococcus sp.]
MDNFYESNIYRHKPWKKALCVLLSIIIAFGALISLTASTEKFKNWVEMRSMLSDYTHGIVNTKGTIAIDKESMLSDNTLINLQNSDGSNTVYLFSEPVSYTDKDGNLKTKDISVEKQKDKDLKAQGYGYTNGQNDYRIHFSTDSSKGLYIEFGKSSYSIIPQSDNVVSGNKSISEILSEQFEDFEYENIYGEGTNLKFYPQLNGVKDEILLNSNIEQNVFSFKIITDNCTAVLNDDGTVSLVNNENKETVQTFSAPFAYDSKYIDGEYNEHYTECEYTLDIIDGNTYLMSVNVDKSWLESNSTVYPVTIDPTTANLSYSYDASIYSAKTSNNYGSEQSCCFGRASDYGYGRVLYYFKMPDDIKKGATINSAYSWVRETTGRTTSTSVTPYVITDSWSETSVTYSNKPNYTTAISLASRNINSASTDNPNSAFWYKFNIAPAVKAWADGQYTNRGLMFISSEEKDGNYNWRAFASRENSTSSYRPYYVINYTNDTTAPTVTSVTGNPTAWTNNNVTLTVNGAKDNTGGAGLHATPYSFSTTKDSYSWQAGNTKTFSSNCTVYVYVRDAVGNIKLASTQTISKIDKTAPSKPTVSGNASDWTTQPITLTASSSDSVSGIKDYSFSSAKGSYSWQTGKTKSFSENTTVYVYARDNAGNISEATEVVISKYAVDPVYRIDPVFYDENNLVGIYNPRAGKESMQYRIGEDGEWITYTVPFAIPMGETVTVYAKFASSQNAVISKTFSSDANLIGAYTESNTDFTLTYKNVSFDFVRTYNSIDKKWFFATDSKVTAVNDYVISAVLPDSTKLSFVKTADNTYTNEINGYTLTKSDDGFVIQLDGVNYTYGTDGKLSKISNKYDDTITVARTDSSITVTDGAERAYTLALDGNGNIISVTDPANNVIAYTYDSSNNLTKVTDQAGVILGQYSYTNGVLTKSMDKTVNYGTDGRVTSYVYDSGAYLNYTYDDENKTVKTTSSVETETSQTYNDALMPVSSTDENGNTIEYTYDSHYRTLTETKDGTTVTYTYDSKGNVLSEVSNDEDAENTYYTYDANGNVTVTQTGNKYTYYVYNSNNELTVSAALKENYTGTIPEQYSEELTCFDTVKYTYENGILIKTVDSKAKETVTNVYDIYGNSVKVSSSTEKDGSIVLKTVDSTYDIMGNLLTTVSGEDTSSYIYDKAGRTLLANENGECTRTLYDNLGRTVQEISPEDYDSSKEGLPENNTYADANVGHRYVYGDKGTLTSETNRLGKTTNYYYNDIGSKIREVFDIYDFSYLNHGELYQIKVANAITAMYNYDNEFKLISETYANNQSIRYKYNENGAVTAQYQISNAKPYVTYTYNADGELTEKVNTDT